MIQKIDLSNSRMRLYVSEYYEVSKTLILVAVFDNLTLVNIEPFGLMDVFQELLSELAVELIKMQVSATLTAGTSLTKLDGSPVVLQSDYKLDFIEPRGMMPPSTHSLWDDTFYYYKIELVYRSKDVPPTVITKKPEWEKVEIAPELFVWLPHSFESYLSDWNATTGNIYLARATKHYWTTYGRQNYPTSPDSFGVFVQIHPMLSQFIQAIPGVFDEIDWGLFPFVYGQPMSGDGLQYYWNVLWPSRITYYLYASYNTYVKDLFEQPALDLFNTEIHHEADPSGDIATPGFLSFGWDPEWPGIDSGVYPSWYDNWMSMRSRMPIMPSWNSTNVHTGNFLARLYYWFEHNFRKFWLYHYTQTGGGYAKWVWNDYHGDDPTVNDPSFFRFFYGSIESPNIKPDEIYCDFMSFRVNAAGNTSPIPTKYPVDVPVIGTGGVGGGLTNLLALAMMAGLTYCNSTGVGKNERKARLY